MSYRFVKGAVFHCFLALTTARGSDPPRQKHEMENMDKARIEDVGPKLSDAISPELLTTFAIPPAALGIEAVKRGVLIPLRALKKGGNISVNLEKLV